jgi:hypothetical protein
MPARSHGLKSSVSGPVGDGETHRYYNFDVTGNFINFRLPPDCEYFGLLRCEVAITLEVLPPDAEAVLATATQTAGNIRTLAAEGAIPSQGIRGGSLVYIATAETDVGELEIVLEGAELPATLEYAIDEA